MEIREKYIRTQRDYETCEGIASVRDIALKHII